MFFIVALSLCGTVRAATITSAGTGNWEAGGTWDLGRVPTDGDVIVIDVGDIVTVTTNNTTCNGSPATHVYVRGVLTFTNGAKLNLGCGSSLTVETGGLITGGSGGGSSKKINICGVEQWSSGDPDVVGPSSFGTPLPIELLEFSVSKNSFDEVEVFWISASEKNNDFYEVFRSTNGLSYELLGKVDGAGNSSSALQYTFIDTEPIGGTVYYKLRQTDFDGTFEEFDPIVMQVELSASKECVLTVYPNPCPGQCKVKLSDCDSDLPELRLMVTDATGHVVNQIYQTSELEYGFDLILDKNNNLKPGVYIISGTKGNRSFSDKVIIE